MIPNLHQNTIYAAHLRAASSSGGKDWVGAVTSMGEIYTYWGKTGMINQRAGKPGDAWGLNKIIDQKKQGKDKYIVIDEYNTKDGWQSQRKPCPVSAKPQKQKQVSTPVVDWNNEAPPASIQWDF